VGSSGLARIAHELFMDDLLINAIRGRFPNQIAKKWEGWQFELSPDNLRFVGRLKESYDS
jgi:hypothetical protein